VVAESVFQHLQRCPVTSRPSAELTQRLLAYSRMVRVDLPQGLVVRGRVFLKPISIRSAIHERERHHVA
jgi:hypothetical protein